MPSSYATFSTLGRVKRMMNRLEETSQIHDEIQTIAAPNLQSTDGQALLAHSNAEKLAVWRAKTEVRRIREGLRKTGWFESSVSPILKDSTTVRRAENLVKYFFLDALKTSAKAAQLVEKCNDSDYKGDSSTTATDELTLCSTIDVLRTVVEEEDEPKSGLPGDVFVAPSEPGSSRGTPSQDEGSGPGG